MKDSHTYSSSGHVGSVLDFILGRWDTCHRFILPFSDGAAGSWSSMPRQDGTDDHQRSADDQRPARPLIGGFVDRRWTDAKEILRKADPDYVSRIESTGQSGDDWLVPSSGLPSKWRHLLAACDELHLLASMAQAAAMGLTPFPYLHGDLLSAEIGQLSAYNGRSWFIQAKALAERTKDVIRKTTQVYISDRTVANAIAERHMEAVKRDVEGHRAQFEQQGTISDLRHEFAHGNNPSWASVITKDSYGHEHLWEAFIARDLTPRLRLEDGFFRTIGQETISGKYGSAVDDTRDVFDRLARILNELEEEIVAYNAGGQG